jgi:two-component system, NarL family, nitrate/nitrite response regulator NarL
VAAQRLTIAIIDDHLLLAEGLRSWFAQNAADVSVSFVGTDPRAALILADELDVALLDVDLGPDAPRTADLVRSFAEHAVTVVLLSAAPRGAALREALLAGAGACVSKTAPPQHLLDVVRQTASGELVLTPELAEVMCSPAPPDLSGQELRALQLYAQGLSLKEVARRMSVTQNTAKEYLDRVRAKYQAAGRMARTRVELQAAARDDGLLDQGQ